MAVDHLQACHDVICQVGVNLHNQFISFPLFFLLQSDVHDLDQELDGAALDEAGEEDHGYKW